MPRRRRDSNSEDENSSSSSSGGDSKRPDHKRSRTDSKSKISPPRVVRYSKDNRHHKEDSGGWKQASSSKYKSSDSYRRQSPIQDRRHSDDRSDSRRRDRDRQDRDDRRNRDIDHRQAGEDRDRTEHRQRSRDHEMEKSKKTEDAKSSSYSKDKGSSSKGTKENEAYSSKRADSGRKDKNVDISTRKERNEDEKTQKSSKDSNEKREPRSQQSTDRPTDDRPLKDEIRIVSETKSKHSEKVTVREKKRINSTSSSSSSNVAHHSSTSDSDGDSDDSNRNYKRIKASKEALNTQIQQKETDKPTAHPEESEERVVSVVEKSEDIQKDTVNRRQRSDNSDTSSDSSEDESKIKHKDHETEEGVKNEIIQHQQTEDENKVTTENQHSDPQEKRIIKESRDGDSNEEKEEGEISEDNEDKTPDMPLKAISAYVSDISSDEGQPEITESKKDKHPKTTPAPQGAPQTSQSPPRRVIESVVPSRKSSKVGRPDKRTVDVLNRETVDIDKAVVTVTSFDDGEVVEGEDNSKRQRPLLESDDDDNASDKEAGLRSQIQGKQRMGSSVSVVKQLSRRKRNRSVDRHESEGEGKKDGISRKDDSRKRERDNDRGRAQIDNRAREKEDDRDKGRDDSRRGQTDNRAREKDDRAKGRDDSRRREKEDNLVRRREDIRGRDKENEHSRGKSDTHGKDREDNQGKERKDDRKMDKGSNVTDSTHDSQRDKNENEEKETSMKSTKTDNSTAAPTVEESGKKPVTAFDITTKTGGAYIPPAKLRMMQALITDKTSVAYQRMSWEALKKSINGLINKVNTSNIINIIKELFQENIVRGRGLLARSVIQAQAASPTFTHVYAALVAIINTKFPQNGELILRRLILMFRRGYKRNDKALCLSSTAFIAHLVNQQVAHEVLALEILTLLLENPTDDSVEVSVGFLKECGQKLTEVSPRGITVTIFERLRNILHEGMLDVRVQYMVEVMFAVRKDGFKDHPAVLTDLDLVEEEEQFTHLLQLEDVVAGDELLNIFKEDPAFAESEEKYKKLKKEILDEGSSDESGESSGSESSESESDDEEKANAEKQIIIDKTETNLVALRRTIYLTVQSSLDHNECAHKMLKMELKPGQEVELCNMILDCCAQLRTYEKFFGLLAQRFCQIDKKYIQPFQQIFIDQYETIHRLETNKVRNLAKLFAHLLYTDAISWGVLSVVKLTEDDTSSASRIFLKILFQELSEYMGLLKLNERLKDPTLSHFFSGFMVKDNPKNTRFCINFFTTIGLGGLTDDLREHLKTAAKHIQETEPAVVADESSSSSGSSSDLSDSDSSSDSESDSPSKKKRKSAARPKKKAGKEDSGLSKKNAADKENKKANRHKRKSSKQENSESRSKSSGRGGRQMSERNSSAESNRRNIADRLLDMAEYGNIQNGDDRARESNDRDRLNRDREVRSQGSKQNESRDSEVRTQGGKQNEGRDRRSEREEQGDVRHQENSERWVPDGRRWNAGNERGVGKRGDSVGYGKRYDGSRDHRVDEDRDKRKGRQYEMTTRRRSEDGSQHQNDNTSSDRRFVSRTGNARRGQNEYDRENTTSKYKVNDEDRRRVFQKGEREKEKRDSSSSEGSDSSPEQVKKRSVRERSVSSPEKRGSKRSLETNASKRSKKGQHKYDTSDTDSDSSDDSHSKSSKSKKVAVRREKR